MKPIEQLLRVGVAIEIDVGVRMAVAGQKLLHPQRAGAMRRADEDDIPEATRNQLDPAEDERPHEDLAQLGVGLHEGEQLLAIELDHLARLADAQRAPMPGGRVIMLPSPENCPGRCVTISVSVAPDGRRTWISPLTTTKNGTTLSPDLDEHVATRDRAAASVRRNPRDLRGGQRRKQMFCMRWLQRDGRRARVHGSPLVDLAFSACSELSHDLVRDQAISMSEAHAT